MNLTNENLLKEDSEKNFVHEEQNTNLLENVPVIIKGTRKFVIPEIDIKDKKPTNVIQVLKTGGLMS